MQQSFGKRTSPQEVLIDSKQTLNKRESKERYSERPTAAVTEGDFSLFPELTQQTRANLIGKGITSLFPIQQHCF
jgi:hypothetical protein